MIINKDERFAHLDSDAQDTLAEVALMKGAVNDKNRKIETLTV